MNIRYLKLINYRNYDNIQIPFNSGVNVFIGDNAQGKTNILESIYYCSIAKSHRTNKDREIINWDKDEAYINVYVNKERLDKNIEIKIFKNGKRAIKVNSIGIKKVADLIGVFSAVIFSPEDLKIVKDSPSYRRRFLDMEICQFSSTYYYNLVQYNKVLAEKSVLLKRYFEGQDEMLNIYDKQLSEFGAKIIKARLDYIELLNRKGSSIHLDITAGMEKIIFKYISTIRDLEEIEKTLLEEITQNRKKDFQRGSSSIGPHRDDLGIFINDIDTKIYGSQGQQRTAVLTIKFSTIDIIKEKTGEYPVLLLDDVLSELDNSRQAYILKSIKNVQTFITCTGIENIINNISSGASIFKVSKGIIIKEGEK